MKISQTISAGFSCVFIFVVIICSTTHYNYKKINNSVNNLVSNTQKNLVLTEDFARGLYHLIGILNDISNTKSSEATQKTKIKISHYLKKLSQQASVLDTNINIEKIEFKGKKNSAIIDELTQVSEKLLATQNKYLTSYDLVSEDPTSLKNAFFDANEALRLVKQDFFSEPEIIAQFQHIASQLKKFEAQIFELIISRENQLARTIEKKINEFNTLFSLERLETAGVDGFGLADIQDNMTYLFNFINNDQGLVKNAIQVSDTTTNFEAVYMAAKNLIQAHVNTLDNLISTLKKDSKKTKELITERVNTSLTTNWILFCGALIGSFIAIGFIIKSIKKSLNYCSNAISRLKMGDLSFESTTSDHSEIGLILLEISDMAKQWRSLIADTQTATSVLRTTTQDVQSIHNTVDHNIGAQQAEIESIATAMQQLLLATQDIALSASNTQTEIQTTEHQIKTSSEIVQRSQAQFVVCFDRFNQVNTSLSSLNGSVDNIKGILNVVTDIAEQTNLLALNAAIEAARAGEQGRGFAVVAEEVRKLASRVSSSVLEIGERLDSLEKTAVQSVNKIGETFGDMEDLKALTTQVTQSFQVIATAINLVGDHALQASSAAEEQSCAAANVNTRVEQIAELSRNTSEHANQSRLSIEQLSQATTDIGTKTQQFSI